MDEKPFVKSEYTDEIPIPVAALPPRTQTRSWLPKRFRTIFKLAAVTAFVVYTHRRAQVNIQTELDLHEGRWVARAFSDSWTWSPRKVLYGKKAEEVFL